MFLVLRLRFLRENSFSPLAFSLGGSEGLAMCRDAFRGDCAPRESPEARRSVQLKANSQKPRISQKKMMTRLLIIGANPGKVLIIREEGKHVSLRLKASYGRLVNSTACPVFACDETRLTG